MKNSIHLFLAACLALFFSQNITAQSAPADSIYMMADKAAAFPGGPAKVTEYLVANVKMPQKCRDIHLGGMSVVEFVVEKDGTPSSFKIGTSATERYVGEPEKFKLAKLFDEEALRLARKMPHWLPAEQNGQPVRMQMRLPVKFTIY